MNSFPVYLNVIFLLVFFVAIWVSIRVFKFNKNSLIILSIWLIFQIALGISGFYSAVNTKFPRFPFLLAPPLMFIIVSVVTTRGRVFLNSLDIRSATILHVLRIPIELILFALYAEDLIPRIMTFEGGNYDIISGITAIFVYYFGFVKPRIGKPWLIAWNLLCLFLVLNIVVIAVLSAPTPIQQFAFDRPNRAIGFFPFMLLPSFLVPMVILSHAASLVQLFRMNNVKLVN